MQMTTAENIQAGPTLEDLDKNKTNVTQKQFKIVILGDGAVGKTSICHRFINDEFGDNYKPTIGLDFYVKRLMIPTPDGKINAALQIWDIGGNSVGSRMLRKYIYGANAVFLCYDITNVQTFLNLRGWHSVVKKTFGESAPPQMVLVGNKVDQMHMRTVTAEEHYKYCEEIGATGYFISARTGENLHPTFYRATGQLCGVKLGKTQVQAVNKVIQAKVIEDYTQNNPFEKTVNDHVQKASRKKNRCVVQ